MASKIEWTEETWNPVVGCSIVSPGCTNCYAMKMAGRLEAMGNAPHYAGTTRKTKAGAVWTGKVVAAPMKTFIDPLRWRKPRKIFVNSMSDLFHPDVPFSVVDKVMAIAALTPRHTYQILTKRPDRMAAYFTWLNASGHLSALANAFERGTMPMSHHEITARLLPDTTPEHRALYGAEAPVWPLPNVWLGASVEDQVRADERRQPMADIAAAGWTTFVSYEPALGEVDWTGWEFLKWLIAGGESGPRARPVHPHWIRDARDWCAEFNVAFFFKQWGTWAPGEANSLRKTLAVDGAHWFDDEWDFVRITAAEGAEMHIDDEPVVWKVGKQHSGRLLDGVEHNAMPEVAHG